MARSGQLSGPRAEMWIALALSAAVVISRAMEHFVSNRLSSGPFDTSQWISLVAAGFAAAGILPLRNSINWLRLQRAFLWTALLLMVWVANGIPFDLLRIVRLIPLAMDGPGFTTRTLALAAVFALARL